MKSLPCSKEPTSELCPEPDEPSLGHPVLLQVHPRLCPTIPSLSDGNPCIYDRIPRLAIFALKLAHQIEGSLQPKPMCSRNFTCYHKVQGL
jgi:hypothetical protein